MICKLVRRTMYDIETTDDLELYARYLGIEAGDFDVFYETYYGIEADVCEELLADAGWA